jgi:hypothetical protein
MVLEVNVMPTLSKVSSVSLPTNNVWQKGSAPVERLQALMEEAKQVQEDVFNALNAKGAGPASQDVIQKTQEKLENLRNDILNSMPIYPDPKGDIQSLLDVGKKFGIAPITLWRITYSTVSPSNQGTDLVSFAAPPSFQSYSTVDHMGDTVSSTAEDVQKIENITVEAMQNPLPFQDQTQSVDLFWKKKTSEILTQKFNQVISNLVSVTSSAQAVKNSGIAESGMLQQTLYLPTEVGGKIQIQPQQFYWLFTKSPDGTWQKV